VCSSDLIHSVVGEEISMEFINSTSAGVFRDTSDLDYIHLIMPVKI
jgi:DNA polymerase III sliding clamp (beta) subunit (PCNA family)